MIYIQGTPTANDMLPCVLFDNLFLRGTVTVSSETTEGPKQNATNEGTYNFWQPSALPATYQVSLPSSMEADSLALVAHNLGSNGTTVTISSSNDGTTWTERASYTPTDNKTKMIVWKPASAFFWRAVFTGGSGSLFVGVLMLGARLVFPGGVRPPYSPLWLSQDVELLVSQTMSGQFITNREIRRGASTQISLVAFERNFVEEDLLPFKNHYDSGKAFIWAAGPCVFDKDVSYAWRQSGAEMKPTFDETGNWMSVTMSVEGYVN